MSPFPIAQLTEVFAKKNALRMVLDVTPAFAAYLARNLGPNPMAPDERQTPDYGVSSAIDGGLVHLDLTFRSGSAYCCTEWGCHLNLREGKTWDRKRQEHAKQGIAALERIELRLTVHVEHGALFFDWLRPEPSRPGWFAFATAATSRYDVAIAEGATHQTETTS